MREIALAGRLAAGLVLAAASPGAPATSDRAPLLDVPYFAQSPELCGGASAAMVLRYWGDDATPESFQPLLRESGFGICTASLAAELARRGWQALAFRGDADEIRRHLFLGRPIIALIEATHPVLHYVVIVGWTDDEVIYHDPAVRPYQSVPVTRFQGSWEVSHRWALLLLPPSVPAVEEPPADRGARGEARSGRCAREVETAVLLARAGDLGGAKATLLALTALDPLCPGAHRELAGVYFLEADWVSAARSAAIATKLAPDDRHAWSLLASSLYLTDRPVEALGAWNRIGEPEIDGVAFEGVKSARFASVQRASGLQPGTVLTPDRLVIARRRLSLFPSIAACRAAFHPTEEGKAIVMISAIEKARNPFSPLRSAVLLLRAGLHRELRLEAVDAFGTDAGWTATYRWWARRPAASFEAAFPGFLRPGWVGIVRGRWERQTYEADRYGSAVESGESSEEFRIAEIETRAWISPHHRVGIAAGYARGGNGRYLTLRNAWECRTTGDEARLEVDAVYWGDPWRGESSGSAGAVVSARRFFGRRGRWEGTVRAGANLADPGAPMLLWSGAGIGVARPYLLRAHPLLHDGRIDGAGFGNFLAHGGGEVALWSHPRPLLPVGIAAFLDAARAEITSETIVRTNADIGAGVRIRFPSAETTLRFDYGYRLSDGRHAVSAALAAEW